jgi:aldehyde:ferredoxin oxidoreductase
MAMLFARPMDESGGSGFVRGWTGKILVVDLGTRQIGETATEDYAREYVGGRGIAARLYWELTNPQIKPLDPENPLIFMTGPLTGTRVTAATIMSVVGKSPAALPESYCYGTIGGYLGTELKKAWFDGVVVTGRADVHSYLWINDGKVEIPDAGSLWGKNALETAAALTEEHGAKARFLVIGVSGEKLVRTATAYASHEGSLSCGYGAVMGSKNLKGILVRGTGEIEVADPDGLRELNRRVISLNKRAHLAIGPDTISTGHAHLLEVVGKGRCHNCGSECIRNVFRYDGRLEGLRHCQTADYYLPWIFGRDDEPVETFFKAPDLANDYCIDTFELRIMCRWLYECHKAGVLTEADTGLPLGEMGTQAFLEKLLHMIANREGFGDLLAEGMARLATSDQVSAEARALMDHGVAPIGEFELEPPRVVIQHALLYPMEPRVHQPLLHHTGFVIAAWFLNRVIPGSTGVTNKVVRDIAKVFWGGEKAGVLNTYEGKALAAKMAQDYTITKDSLGLCDFTWPIIYSFATDDMVGDPTLEGQIYSAVTGRAAEDLQRAAERTANLQRMILIREGRRPSDDYPPEYNFTEPLAATLSMHWTEVPGEGEESVSMLGNVLDRGKFEAMLKEYYRLRGWDEKTGVPKTETLESLGLEDVVDPPVVTLV